MGRSPLNDTSENIKLRSIVAEALDHSAHERSSVLDRLCGGDAELRRMAGGLVEAQDAVQQNINRLLNFSEDDLTAATMSPPSVSRTDLTQVERTQNDVTQSEATTTEVANRPSE